MGDTVQMPFTETRPVPEAPIEPVCCAPASREAIGTDEAERLARLLKAVADPARLRLVSLVAAHADLEACVCDLTDLLDAAQSRLSFHLKVLKDAGLVTARREGRWMHYDLIPRALDEVQALVGEMKPSERQLRVRAANACC